MGANPALWADIRSDLDAAGDHARRAAEARDELDSATGLSPVTAEALGHSVGKHLHDAYTALERLVVAVDGDRPRGADFHRQLLLRAARPIPEVRPAIIPEEVVEDLSALLGFRHVFRHSYVAYRAERAVPNVEVALRVVPRAAGAVERFCRDFGIAPPGDASRAERD
jgi:hypothetical protein